MRTNPKIIVVGGNAAGPSAAAKAKRTNPDAEVILFEAGPFISTGTCELPYLLGNVIDDYKKLVFFSPEEFYEEKKVKTYVNHAVEAIDRKQKSISVKNSNEGIGYTYDYDKLILCTGAVAKKLPDAQLEADNLFNLKSVSDYLKIAEYLERMDPKNVVIFGAGYIGIETAENFKKLGLSVTLVEKSKLPMPSLEIETSHLIKDKIEKEGLDFIGGFSSVKFNTSNSKIKSVNIDGRVLETCIVISSIGFEPNNRLALAANMKVGSKGGLSVSKKMQTSDSSIFAAGDCVEITNFIINQPDYIPLATLAHEQGHVAGANAAGANKMISPVIKNTAVKVFDKVLATIGLNSSGAQHHEILTKTVKVVAPNLVKVMPQSEQTFGKLIFEKGSNKIVGAEFLGNSEVIGYADLISALILQKEKIDILTRINFNYTPPNSPFINILSILGRKALKA